MIKTYKQNWFDEYLSNLGSEVDKDYSLWRTTRNYKRPITGVPPLRDIHRN